MYQNLRWCKSYFKHIFFLFQQSAIPSHFLLTRKLFRKEPKTSIQNQQTWKYIDFISGQMRRSWILSHRCPENPIRRPNITPIKSSFGTISIKFDLGTRSNCQFEANQYKSEDYWYYLYDQASWYLGGWDLLMKRFDQSIKTLWKYDQSLKLW